mmetsp:Transcript_23539/g.40098  ORF Transcript_23539/g.40098 Transcript_23539/m.40098 type:complete len:92 (+) Transcript_23539:939-1214(+)
MLRTSAIAVVLKASNCLLHLLSYKSPLCKHLRISMLCPHSLRKCRPSKSKQMSCRDFGTDKCDDIEEPGEDIEEPRVYDGMDGNCKSYRTR